MSFVLLSRVSQCSSIRTPLIFISLAARSPAICTGLDTSAPLCSWRRKLGSAKGSYKPPHGMSQAIAEINVALAQRPHP
ncbi:hypothetical protein B0T14DRAFT_513798, partial [Immersiella caudata]